MNKAILMSIQPQHAVNILKGKKTLELRKTVPKNFKGWVYIYVTKAKPYLYIDYYYKGFNAKINLWHKVANLLMIDYVPILNGKVVARFWFDEYIAYKYYKDDNSYFAKRPQDFGYNAEEVLKRLCLSRDEFKTYGKGKDLYAWHIKDLEIFKEPMELSKFYKLDIGKTESAYIRLKRPPQSWQYVYVEGEEG